MPGVALRAWRFVGVETRKIPETAEEIPQVLALPELILHLPGFSGYPD